MAQSSDVRIGLNPAPQKPPTKPAKLPTAAQLKGVLGTYEFHGSKWAFKSPVGFKASAVIKTITVQKGGNGDVETVKAHILKDNRVVFEKTGGHLAGAQRWLGPVNYKILPKNPHIPLNPVPNRK